MLSRGRRQSRAFLLISSLACAWPSYGFAQATAQIPLQFDFLNPGARSLALGGSFVGAADDATAAFGNPAGLARRVQTREASFEFRFRRTETPFLEAGRVSGTPTFQGPDILGGPSYGTDVDTSVAPSFISFVQPLSGVTVAVYRHEPASMENSFFSFGPFERATLAGAVENTARELPLGGTRTIDIVSYGGTVSRTFGDKLALGAGLTINAFDLESHFARFTFVSDIFSAPNRDVVTATADQDGEDVSLGWNAGALWTVSSRVQAGGQFRKNPGFDFTQRDIVPGNDEDLLRRGRFKMPDVAGGGVEVKLGEREHIRLLADYTFVRYSQLKEDFVDIQSISSGRQGQLRIDDGHEVHAGLEYQLLDLPHPMALRIGAWLDPDHTVRYEATEAHDTIDARLSAALPGGVDEMHYTAGAGIAFGRHEVNAGVDVSERTISLTASAVFRF